MIGRDQELDRLAKAFHATAADTLLKLKRLNGVLQKLTAETCPLSPCEDCVLVKCMLRRVKTNGTK